MTLELNSNLDVYCFLKSALEPEYQVNTEPGAGYFAEWNFCYRIFHDGRLIEELSGDFRDLPENALATKARDIVNRLRRVQHSNSQVAIKTPELPFASRLPPRHDDHTWFSSGRAAFAWLIEQAVRPRQIFLPTFICWSLVEVIHSQFPDIELSFYTVDRYLNADYPQDVDSDAALVFVHYFGHMSHHPNTESNCTVLEDASHLLLNHDHAQPAASGFYRFGSLRKTYRVADGGFIRGAFNPTYAPRRNQDAWLRLNAKDWRDLREAENMTDRAWNVSDICSQSLAVILKTDELAAAEQRRTNNDFLHHNLIAGRPLITYASDETPLLHSRTFGTQEERDSLRVFLAGRNVFTSIHWPTHAYLLQNRDRFNIEGAVWLEQHTLAIPVSDEFQMQHMEHVCNAVRDWSRAGSARFIGRAAG